MIKRVKDLEVVLGAAAEKCRESGDALAERHLKWVILIPPFGAVLLVSLLWPSVTLSSGEAILRKISQVVTKQSTALISSQLLQIREISYIFSPDKAPQRNVHPFIHL